MSDNFNLDFEAPIIELENKMHELKNFGNEQNIDVKNEIENMKQKIVSMRKEIYKNLTSWQKVQVARHPNRPYTMDYIKLITNDFIEIHGDRIHRDDRAIIGGFAKIEDEKIYLEAELFSIDGKQRFYYKAFKDINCSIELGKEVGEILKKESKNSYKR